ncbi:MAG: prepilin-type N-terminal cleavage/methylation domain-containing protein [Phycisphaeraceae bacterium]|nr:prepilin-type N-terminal cleavage/methylation domain-containing protein [Phycisphaeraceae bacterium]
MLKQTIRKGFTLVEILIVVVILGILAAIVVPQFTNATQDAQAGNIKAQLDTLNNQIELFRARTNAYPDFTATTVWDDMIKDGYVKSAPLNPFNGLSTVNVGSSTATGWYWYTDANGQSSLCATNFNNDKTDPNYGKITPGVSVP